MILSSKRQKYFRSVEAKVSQAMAKSGATVPYLIEGDPAIVNYEIIRKVWHEGQAIKNVCDIYDISRTQYYEKESDFTRYGIIGLFQKIRPVLTLPRLERLVLLVKEARPSLSRQDILRIAEALPLTKNEADIDDISQILSSYGLGTGSQTTDQVFWRRVQRTLKEIDRLKTEPIMIRDKKRRKEFFFQDDDVLHKRLEILRELFLVPSLSPKDVCQRHGVAMTSYYRLTKDYRLFGPFAIISANLPGKEAMNRETELNVLLNKLRYPSWSAQKMVDYMKLSCSRYAINRIYKRWDLTNKNCSPVVLDHYVKEETDVREKEFTSRPSAYRLISEESLLKSRRINRHFKLIRAKMKIRSYHLCDPGPFILAPFVSDLGIVQAMESYGPTSLRGQELTNLALLNVFRILAGYRCINHLSDNRDQSVALASGIGMFGTKSRYYQDTMEFKFDHIHSLRSDLVNRAKELGLIEGVKIAFDFHMKQFYGKYGKEKGIGKGPDKSGNMVAGFRPHIAWDLATNTILSMTYYHGGTRGPSITEQYCEQHIFPFFNPKAIQEIYMDSEYTKEASLRYFKQVKCPNGDVYICLKKNKQIKKLISSALTDGGWENHLEDDEVISLSTILPRTLIPLKIIILRDNKTKKNIRCFGSTNLSLSPKDILNKYRFRWLIENGIKDLVHNYFLDEMFGRDPEKIEFEFYCVMIARLAYEHFLKKLGGEHYRQNNGNKTNLATMRNLLFEKRNFTLAQNSKGNFVMTILDMNGDKLEKSVSSLLKKQMEAGENKVLWWENQGINLEFKNQYKI